MKTFKNQDLIKKHEGLRLKAYMPTKNDVPTIGWGHTKGVKMGDTIDMNQAQAFFDQDIQWAVDAVNKLVKVPINQNQFDAMVSLTFNIGEAGFSRSSVLKRLNSGDVQGAADAFLMWDKQRNKRTGKLEPLRGLQKRRKEERELFLTPSSSSHSSPPESCSESTLDKFINSIKFWKNK